jgi:3' terminal RNA ribose 2'-O-methyltransferase Hen1
VLLTISTTIAPARDLGYLLHKHPDRVQEFTQSFGHATVLFPEATDERTTAALVLDVDPVRLARSRPRNAPDFSLAQYVNDRSYAASSLLAVALGDVFTTARSGRCRAKQELADTEIPLELELPVLPCRGGAEIAHRLFEPLGWAVRADPLPLDERFPAWGDSRYVRLRLSGTVRLADALNQLYVLLPVLDESKHYWQAADEVDKLLRSGGAWLATHPERELITRRYLARTGMTGVALARLAELDDESPDEVDRTDRPTPLNIRRRDAVLDALAELGAGTVIDLGCGQGQLVSALLRHSATGGPSYTKVAGMEVSSRALRQAARSLRVDDLGERQAERLELFQGSLTYEDPRLEGYDAAVLMEVIEHVDPSRLGAVEHVVFGSARPGAVLVTTPNADYNPRYEHLVGMRHPDHRFEWSRAEFAAWAGGVAERHGYTVELRGIGDPDPELGPPTQLGVFRRG